MMRWFLSAAFILLAVPAWASFYVCGTDIDNVDPSFRTYFPTLDPSRAPVDCYEVAPANIGAQHSLITTTDWRKLRIDPVAHLAVLKSQTVRDAIDTADAARQAELESVTAELQGAGCKSDSFAEAEQKIQNQMDQARADANAITNVTTARTAALTTINKTELILKNVARCFFALARRPR